MNTAIAGQEIWPKRIHTKIVGTSFEGRQALLARCRDQQVDELLLLRDPGNAYDPYAVAVCAHIRNEQGNRVMVRLGYLANSDRICADCGTLVGGAAFEASRTLRCPDCGHIFGYDDPAVTQRNNIATLSCPACSASIELGLAKVVQCPTCGGMDFGRDGLGTLFSRALLAGIRYRVLVTEYTGGTTDPSGRSRSIGCNIVIRRD